MNNYTSTCVYFYIHTPTCHYQGLYASTNFFSCLSFSRMLVCLSLLDVLTAKGYHTLQPDDTPLQPLTSEPHWKCIGTRQFLFVFNRSLLFPEVSHVTLLRQKAQILCQPRFRHHCLTIHIRFWKRNTYFLCFFNFVFNSFLLLHVTRLFFFCFFFFFYIQFILFFFIY